MSDIIDRALDEQEIRLVKDGMPHDFLDECTYCQGSGCEEYHYGVGDCPDCQATGFKYGLEAQKYSEEWGNNVYALLETMKEHLVTEHGYIQKRFVTPNDEKFLLSFFGHLFSREYFNDHQKMIDEFRREIPGVVFDKKPNVCGSVTSLGTLMIYIGISVEEVKKNPETIVYPDYVVLAFEKDVCRTFGGVFSSLVEEEVFELAWLDLDSIPNDAESYYVRADFI